MLKLENKTILIISNEPWGNVWYSKHNWANELSKQNQVFFVNSPHRWSFLDLFSFKVIVKPYSNSLRIIDYNNRLPLTRFKVIYKLNNFLVSKGLKKWLLRNKHKDIIFWSFDPYKLTNPKLFSPLKSIFFRVDKIHKNFIQQEIEFIKNIDDVIVTSGELLKDINVANPLILSHGISQEEFTHDDSVKYKKGYILYVGQIDYRLDVNLIEKMLIAFPNEQFIFIGKLLNIDNPIFKKVFFDHAYSNLTLHGTEHFKKLKNFIYNAKACLAPMDLTVYGNDVHHHKSLQYLAMGKPVISPLFKDAVNKEEFISGYKNSDEAISQIRNLETTETEKKVNDRVIYAKQFLYSNLIKEIEIFLTQ